MIKHLQAFIGAGTNPHRNLAIEEYLTDTVPEDTLIVYLWQNRHTVVIGRNQNAWAECRTAELERDGGTLARRLSGGGAVYHDMGNLNFTFSLRTQDYDLRRQQGVIVEACRSLGIPAEISGRNDILTNGCKFSGNSFYSHNGCSFHNGTLLLSVDMANLGKYLTPSKVKLESKGVASVRSRVINLTELRPSLTVAEMADAMVKAAETVYGLKASMLSEADFDEAEIKKRYQRFSSFDWNYGKSVPCTFECARRFSWGEVTVQLLVKNGCCEDAAVYSDAMDAEFAAPLAAAFRSCRFTPDELCARVRQTPQCAAVAEDLCELLQSQAL